MSARSSPRLSLHLGRSFRPISPADNATADPAVSFAITATSLNEDLRDPARASSPAAPPRRNRNALRDYYNLNRSSTGLSSARQSFQSQRPGSRGTEGRFSSSNTELDNPNFDADAYVARFLETSSLATILRAETSLKTDIRSLDAERKALVYDNYSKLINAVKTIGKMRESIDETSQTSIYPKTLEPAMDSIKQTVEGLLEDRKQFATNGETNTAHSDEGRKPRIETVKWVLNMPSRLEFLLQHDKADEATREYEEITPLLSKWAEVRGTKETRQRCEAILESKQTGSQENKERNSQA